MVNPLGECTKESVSCPKIDGCIIVHQNTLISVGFVFIATPARPVVKFNLLSDTLKGVNSVNNTQNTHDQLRILKQNDITYRIDVSNW